MTINFSIQIYLYTYRVYVTTMSKYSQLASVPALSCRLGCVSYNRAFGALSSLTFGALTCCIQSRLQRSLTRVTKRCSCKSKKISLAGFELGIKSL